jgi:hypothetical protein
LLFHRVKNFLVVAICSGVCYFNSGSGDTESKAPIHQIDPIVEPGSMLSAQRGAESRATFAFVLIPIYYGAGLIPFRGDTFRIEHGMPERKSFPEGLSAERRNWHIACAKLSDYRSSVMQGEQE